MVEFVDCSTIGLSSAVPDMRIPIANTLAWPDRMDDTLPAARSRVPSAGSISKRPTKCAFPRSGCAREAIEQGGSAPATLNAANEIAVAAFLEGRIGFLDIAATVETVIDRSNVAPVRSLDDVRAADAAARGQALDITGRLAEGLTV